MKYLILLLCIFTTQIHAQSIDKWLLTEDIAVRGFDVYSTHYMLENGNHEKFLPDVISHNVPIMAVYSGAVVTTDWFIMHKLESHHPRLAHTLEIINIDQDAYFAINNIFLPKGRVNK